MPSIPQSLLWISLVVLWLFVLVPMLVSKRETVRRTSDVALATRVLNSTTGARLLRRRKPAAGHRSDPQWRPMANVDDWDDFDGDDSVTAPRKTIVLAANEESTDSLYLDVDIVEEGSGALPVGVSAAEEATVQEPELTLDLGLDEVAEDEAAEESVEEELVAEESVAEADTEADAASTAAIRTLSDADFVDLDGAIDTGAVPAEPAAEDMAEEVAEDEVAQEVDESDGTDYDYEYVDDSSGLEDPSDAEMSGPQPLSASRRQRTESKTAAAVAARKYKFRKRMLTAMGVALLVSAAVAYVVTPTMWWACGSIGAVTLLYLGYLRRQTRIEEQVRRRRAQRMARSRLGVENTEDQEFEVVPSRLRRPGSVVLEIDDEDPIFEHLEYAAFEEYDLPRAAGQ